MVRKILEDIQKNGISDEELQQAKSKVLSRVVRGSERPMGRMQAIGMAWTYLHQYRTVDDELQGFELQPALDAAANDSSSLDSIRCEVACRDCTRGSRTQIGEIAVVEQDRARLAAAGIENYDRAHETGEAMRGVVEKPRPDLDRENIPSRDCCGLHIYFAMDGRQVQAEHGRHRDVPFR